ncbi:TlpA family protein disulfide reductase [Stieleria sp.]|uniref:TlpA family protein disulfide reductase n=1 Tax=Stieleria sp. TaxID=2795976 RepID=UPI0035679C35
MRIRMLSGESANTVFAVLLSVVFVLSGCSRDDVESTSPDAPAAATGEGDEELIRSAADMAADGEEPDVGSDAFSQQTTPLPSTIGERGDLTGRRTTPSGSTAPSPPDSPSESPRGFELAETTAIPAGIPEMIDAAGAVAAQRELRDDLTADQLMTYLEESDRDMEMLARGRDQLQDPNQANELMRQLANSKLQASVRLQAHADATEKQRTAGLRGQLQALSHLSAMGDLSSAKALEALARENLSSPVPTIAGDSRIVLIGFAIDGLRAGRESAAQEIVSLIEGMTASRTADIPAVLMMAEARQVLANYGLIDESARVREKILALYGNSPDKMIAQVAADAAGTAKYDSARRLLGEILENDNVALARWTEAVTELIREAPEMNTVEFLGTSALQLEAAQREAFVEETFRILAEGFADTDSATANEIETARMAMEARRDVIGTSFDALANLPTLDGSGISSISVKGKVVLMPFWAVTIPQSLQIVPMLKEIQSRHPDQIAIVGMNLDSEQAPLGEFLAQNDLGFPSFRSVSSSNGDQGNPIATKFGLVSLPFVAIFNQAGKVAALDFTGMQLETTVEQLVQSADDASNAE